MFGERLVSAGGNLLNRSARRGLGLHSALAAARAHTASFQLDVRPILGHSYTAPMPSREPYIIHVHV